MNICVKGCRRMGGRLPAYGRHRALFRRAAASIQATLVCWRQPGVPEPLPGLGPSGWRSLARDLPRPWAALGAAGYALMSGLGKQFDRAG